MRRTPARRMLCGPWPKGGTVCAPVRSFSSPLWSTGRSSERAAADLGVASIPGAHTPTEMLAAHQAGAPLVKIFRGRRRSTRQTRRTVKPGAGFSPTGRHWGSGLETWFILIPSEPLTGYRTSRGSWCPIGQPRSLGRHSAGRQRIGATPGGRIPPGRHAWTFSPPSARRLNTPPPNCS